jgi:hypothetical protein
MNWLIERKLNKISKKAGPSSAYVTRLERTLRTQSGHSLRWIEWKRVAIASLTGFSLLVSGTGVYAYTSDEVLPDHPLYDLRQEIESAEERIAVTPALKFEVIEKHLRRKERERVRIEQRRRQHEERKEERQESKRLNHDEVSKVDGRNRQ